jgi:signal transduction histidine kinase/ActR/RegA family two-component response regulator
MGNVLGILRRRPRLNILAFTVTVLVTVGSLEIADLWWRRDRALEQAQSRAGNLALVLAAYVHGSLTSADAALRQMMLHNTQVGGPAAAPAAWDPTLASARSALPEVGAFSVTDRDGTITHSTIKAIVGASRRDDFLFRQLAARDTVELLVDRPFLSITAPQQYVVPVGHRLTDAQGRFDGTVVASIRPESYRGFFRTLDLGTGGTITIRHSEGAVLFREPPRSEQGRTSDGAIVADRPVAGTPLVVSVSLPHGDVLADWYRQRRVGAVAYGALALTLSAIVALLFRVVSARERAERELAAVQRQEAERLRVSNDRLADALEREQAARRAVEEASYMKDEFLMTVSHELRTPLTAIYGWVRMLASREMPRAGQEKAFGAIERNAVAQTRLIDDLLDVSRAISGKLRLESRAVDVAAVVRAAIETLTPAIAAKRLQLEVSCDPRLAPIAADPDRLQQIVWNLLSNAIKFTPEGGRIQVRTARADGDRVEILIADNGVGIAPAFLPHVFDRFRQGDAGTRRRYGGLGLGLAIVRHLVELHGGTVGVESAGEGTGSTFRVLLPAGERGQSAVATPLSPDTTAIAAPRLDAVRVLVVDDEADARELFAHILEAAGARVRTVGSAADALTLLAAEPFDVLLSDIEMATMDGYELIRLVRADPRLGQPRLAAVALTAYARTADRRRALDAGFDEHVAKPVDPQALVAAVAALVPGR